MLCAVGYAQETYDIDKADSTIRANGGYLISSSDDGRLVFDLNTKSYTSRKEFIQKYGKKTFQKVEELDNKRKEEEAAAKQAEEKAETRKRAMEALLAIDSYESVAYNDNKYNYILDAIDGAQDDIIDYLGAALFSRKT